MILTDVELDELEDAARKATPGPWTEDDGNIFSKPLTDKRHEVIMRRLAGEKIPHPDHPPGRPGAEAPLGFVATTTQEQVNFEADSEYIAAANPEVVLQLIAEIRVLRIFKAKLKS